MFSSQSTQPLYAGLGFADTAFVGAHFGSNTVPQTLVDDPNSPEAFKQSVNLIQQQLLRVQDLARSALSGIENSYRPGNSTTQTTEYLTALRQSLQLLIDLLRQSGVGALPMLDANDPLGSLLTEEALLAHVTQSIETEYARQKRIQDGASVVFNLLGAAELTGRK
ncbi:hypothetical protein BDW22DRAFT_1432496 [Trametopsis cervina]|nr:hypothetical protein BDW22DRAFT_1432496 [Trametopsis cervina]